MSGRFALLCSVKDEAAYIIDWVAHYRALGFTQIVLFQNGSVDGTDRLCQALANKGLITYFDNTEPRAAPPRFRDLPAQRRAYGWALRVPQIQEADYLMVVDIDEYLELPKDRDFPALLDRLDWPDVVSFAWRMMGANGHTRFEATPVAERFVRGANAKNTGTGRPFNQYKSAYPPRSTRLYNLHRPRRPKSKKLRWVTPSGRNIQTEAQAGNTLANFPYSFANLRHYHVKSLAEFKLKMVRGFASHDPKKSPQFGLPMFDAQNSNEISLPFETQAYRDGLELAAEIRNDPVIMAIEQDCLERFGKLVHLAGTAVDRLEVFKKANYIQADFSEYFRREVYERL